jgi:hypothetical protein
MHSLSLSLSLSHTHTPEQLEQKLTATDTQPPLTPKYDSEQTHQHRAFASLPTSTFETYREQSLTRPSPLPLGNNMQNKQNMPSLSQGLDLRLQSLPAPEDPRGGRKSISGLPATPPPPRRDIESADIVSDYTNPLSLSLDPSMNGLQRHLEAQIQELRAELHRDAQERAQMVSAAGARARSLEEENKQLKREALTFRRLSSAVSVQLNSNELSTTPVQAPPSQNTLYASVQSTGSELRAAAHQIDVLAAELREERQLLALQRKERELLENNLCESKLMVSSLTEELASVKHSAGVNEQELKALAHAREELKQVHQNKEALERRLSEVEAELKTALIDRASVRSQQRQASMEREHTDQQRDSMAITVEKLNEDHGFLKNELSVALSDKNKAEAALRSSMEEVQLLKCKLSNGRWQAAFPYGTGAEATRPALSGLGAMQQELEDSRSALEAARRGVEEIRSKMKDPSPTGGAEGSFVAYGAGGGGEGRAERGGERRAERELQMLARHSEQMRDYERTIQELQHQVEAARREAQEESVARQAGDDLNAELLEQLENSRENLVVASAASAGALSSFLPTAFTPGYSTRPRSSTVFASPVRPGYKQQHDPRFDDTLEKVKRALANMKKDVI